MIDEFDDFTTVTLQPIDVNTSPAMRAETADAVPVESTAASEDARVDLFLPTFNARSATRTDNSRL